MKGPIQSVEVSYLVHSTEDQQRIGKAVEKMLGMNAVANVEELEGHFGNKIVRVSYHLTGEEASFAFYKLASDLPSAAREELFGNLEKMMDEHSALYLRLDKQSLVAGRFEFGGGEVVRLRVKPRLFFLKGGLLCFTEAPWRGTDDFEAVHPP